MADTTEWVHPLATAMDILTVHGAMTTAGAILTMAIIPRGMAIIHLIITMATEDTGTDIITVTGMAIMEMDTTHTVTQPADIMVREGR